MDVISGLRLYPRTVQKKTSGHDISFLSPRPGHATSFMAAAADTEHNFNACPYLKTYPYRYNLCPEAFIQNSTTKQADTTSHFLIPRAGTCDIIFMAAVADTKRNF